MWKRICRRVTVWWVKFDLRVNEYQTECTNRALAASEDPDMDVGFRANLRGLQSNRQMLLAELNQLNQEDIK
jgi:hypothetical protein